MGEGREWISGEGASCTKAADALKNKAYSHKDRFLECLVFNVKVEVTKRKEVVKCGLDFESPCGQ